MSCQKLGKPRGALAQARVKEKEMMRENVKSKLRAESIAIENHSSTKKEQ